jgi:hypothetical protein
MLRYPKIKHEKFVTPSDQGMKTILNPQSSTQIEKPLSPTDAILHSLRKQINVQTQITLQLHMFALIMYIQENILP